MHNHEQPQIHKPMSGARHFWLSFLAVVTGTQVSMIISGIVFFGFFVVFGLLIAVAGGGAAPDTKLPLTLAYGDETASGTVAVVPVRGVILSGTAADPLAALFGQSFADGELIKDQLRILADDTSVDAVVLDIDSPGGMITASKAIADGIQYYKDTAKKPIISHINGLGASGAYWAAAATDEIYAEQGSEVGSIGVIFGPLVTLSGVVGYGDIATREPISFKYFTAGRSKDLGSPYRPLTAEEEAFLNQEIANEYERFVTHVSDSRDIPAETIKSDIGALAYGTTSALSKKLMDGEASKEEAYGIAAERAGIDVSYNVKRVDMAASFFGSLFGANRPAFLGGLSASEKSTGRKTFCDAHLVARPLVLSGSLDAVCQ